MRGARSLELDWWEKWDEHEVVAMAVMVAVVVVAAVVVK